MCYYYCVCFAAVIETPFMMARHGSTGTSISLLILLALTAQLQAALATTTTACSPGDRYALLAFKAGIKADPKGFFSTWNVNTDCCTWGNIRCNSARRVISLDVRPDPLHEFDTDIFLEGEHLSLDWHDFEYGGIRENLILPDSPNGHYLWHKLSGS